MIWPEKKTYQIFVWSSLCAKLQQGGVGGGGLLARAQGPIDLMGPFPPEEISDQQFLTGDEFSIQSNSSNSSRN